MTDLGTLGGAESDPSALNEHDQVVGLGRTARGKGHAVLWTLRTAPDALRRDEHAARRPAEARLDRVVRRRPADRTGPTSEARSSRPARTWSISTGSATAGSSEPYIVPVSHFSRRVNWAGSRSSREPGRRQADDHRRAAAARALERGDAHRRVTDRVEGVVDALRRDRRELRLELGRVERVRRAELERLLAPRLDGIGADDRRGTRDPRALHQELADAARRRGRAPTSPPTRAPRTARHRPRSGPRTRAAPPRAAVSRRRSAAPALARRPRARRARRSPCRGRRSRRRTRSRSSRPRACPPRSRWCSGTHAAGRPRRQSPHTPHDGAHESTTSSPGASPTPSSRPPRPRPLPRGRAPSASAAGTRPSPGGGRCRRSPRRSSRRRPRPGRAPRRSTSTTSNGCPTPPGRAAARRSSTSRAERGLHRRAVVTTQTFVSA